MYQKRRRRCNKRQKGQSLKLPDVAAEKYADRYTLLYSSIFDCQNRNKLPSRLPTFLALQLIAPLM
jgi:hypothetical protein